MHTYLFAHMNTHTKVKRKEIKEGGGRERRREGERKSQTWPVIPAFGKQKWKDHGFKAKLGYIVQNYPELHEILSQKRVVENENDHLFLPHRNLIPSETAIISTCVPAPLLVLSH